MFHFLLPSWPWWMSVLDAAVMCGVVVTLQAVLVRDPVRTDRMRAAGLLGYGGFALLDVLDVLGRPTIPGLSLVCGLAAPIWTALALRAQWRDDRRRPSTVRYGIAALLASLAAGGMSRPLGQRGDLLYGAVGAVGALTMVWLARSAHDPAGPASPAGPGLTPPRAPPGLTGVLLRHLSGRRPAPPCPRHARRRPEGRVTPGGGPGESLSRKIAIPKFRICG
ncbi:hypothetical protein [Streptosporangium sp. NPDC023615]|uniref:hypothetical protein n=1 Tax=Streptosporangium sp. NPDC023615 TaxID=3154794 RepID=UPI00341AE0DB